MFKFFKKKKAETPLRILLKKAHKHIHKNDMEITRLKDIIKNLDNSNRDLKVQLLYYEGEFAIKDETIDNLKNG